MKKTLFLLLVLLGAGSSLSAQNPTAVSGTITDPNGVAYFPATVTACLTPVTTDPIVNGQHVNQQIGRNYCAPLANTSPTGFFSLGLFPNSAITPGGTQWQFTVTAAGSAQPAGKGSQTFQVSITISGTSQDVGATLSAAAPALLNSGSGGITSVSSLPATCTIGTSVFLTVAATGQPIGQYNCTATNFFTFIGPDIVNTVNPINYGVKSDVKLCRDTNAKFTTTTTVTCSSGLFLPTDCTGGSGCTGTASKVIFGTCCGIQGGPTHPASLLLLPQGTISTYISATQVTVSLAGTAATCAAGGAGCLLLWGTDDSAAWDAAWTAATGTAGVCKPLTFSGMSFISTAKFLTSVCNTGITGPGSQGTSILGYGYKTSMFVVLPNFNGATCTGVSTSPLNVGCFGPSLGLQLINMGIWGGENGNSTALNGKIFLDLGIDSYLFNVLLAGLASGTGTTMVGVVLEATGQTMQTMVVDGFGGGTAAQPSCMVVGGNYNGFQQSFCGNTQGRALLVQGSGTILNSSQSFYGQVIGGSNGADVITGALLKSKNDIFFTTSAGAALGVDATSTAQLDNDLISNPSNVALYLTAAGAKANAINTVFTGQAAGKDVFITGASTYKDFGGNTYTNGVASLAPTCTFTSGGGTTPSCALQAGSTNEKGTIIASTGTGAPGTTGTVTLTFFGLFIGSGGLAPSCNFTPNDSGTAWANGSSARVSTQSTTAPIIAWSNFNATTPALLALTVSSPYRIDYVCTAR